MADDEQADHPISVRVWREPQIGSSVPAPRTWPPQLDQLRPPSHNAAGHEPAWNLVPSPAHTDPEAPSTIVRTDTPFALRADTNSEPPVLIALSSSGLTVPHWASVLPAPRTAIASLGPAIPGRAATTPGGAFDTSAFDSTAFDSSPAVPDPAPHEAPVVGRCGDCCAYGGRGKLKRQNGESSAMLQAASTMTSFETPAV